MGEFITWLNANQGAVMALLTLTYVITTILLLVSNRRQRKQNKNIQKQNVRVQLFEKRYEVYKETEEFFMELMKNDYDGLKILALIMASEEDEYDFDFGFIKILHLFGVSTYDSAKELYVIAGDISRKIRELSKVYEYTISRDKEEEFKQFVKITPKEILIKPDAKLKAICDKYELRDIKLGNEEDRDYNYYDLHIKKGELIAGFIRDYNHLLKSMEKELHMDYVEV